MVVGNGIIAKAFRNFKENDDVVIFASGVSNSKEERDSEFIREINLLKSFKYLDKKIIYFSTCSVFDVSIQNSKYIKHKIQIESFIKDNFNKYIIFRLPNVIGAAGNNNTFFNFVKNKILNQEEIEIQKNATRYFIDIDDVQNLLSPVIEDVNYNNNIINVCFNNKIKVSEIVDIIENTLNIYTQKKIINYGFDYEVKNEDFIKIIDNFNYKFDKEYNFNLIKKYI